MLTQVVSYPKRLESVHVRNGERYIAWSTDTPKVEDFKEIPGMVWQPEIEARLEGLSVAISNGRSVQHRRDHRSERNAPHGQ